MDKIKLSVRSSKGKTSTIAGGELFALGSKVTSRDDKSKFHGGKVSSASNERKREAPAVSIPSKKLKSNAAPLTIFSDDECSTGNIIVETWEKIALESDPLDMIISLYSAIEEQDFKTVIALLCGTVKSLGLTSSRTKTESIVNLLLIYVSKIRPVLFCNDITITALLSLLKRETSHIFKSKPSSCTYVTVTNILYRGSANKKEWPQSFLRVYLDDAVNDRLWVDNELCAPLVMNICSTFGTLVPPKSFLQAELGNVSSSSSQHVNAITLAIDEDSRDQNSTHVSEFAAITQKRFAGSCLKCDVEDRFAACSDAIEQQIIENVKETLNRRQTQDGHTRNFLKFLCTTSGIDEVRYLSTLRLEMWLHNGKLIKTAQELLAYICFNINSRSVKHRDVLSNLVKMRLKTKPLINFFMSCLKKVIVLNTNTLPITLKLVLQNELSSVRNPNNMGLLATMFQVCPEKSARHLAEIYKECLLQREDCLRTLRVFLRELVRILRFDINIVEFCKSFLNGRPELTPQIQQSEHKERVFHSVVDIICLCMLLSVSPSVREALVSQRNGRDVKSNRALLQFYQQISQIQLDTISWMYEIVPNLYSLQGSDFSQALHKILLLESPDQYSRSDQWPSEPERSTILRMVAETPIYEDTLLRIILIGITHDIPFTIAETFEVLVQVIKRASALRNADVPVIHANKFEVIDFLFSMAEYHCPDKIKLPKDYSPPKLAISVLYWKAWTIMLMISSHNPSTFGAFCWNHYPTMKMLIEMCITNQFNESSLTKEEFQIASIEREQIIEFEKHLAAQTSQTVITEENAILITQVMLMDPMGSARRIPSLVLEQLKHLNKQLKLGHLLCRSRKPDLLLEIIQKQGTTQAMPWLSDLVQNSDGEFRHLPVQCLCEFLLSNADTLTEENSRDAKLLKYLRKLIEEKNSNKKTVCEVLDCIFRRLSSTVKQFRKAALAALKLLLKDTENWLLLTLPNIPYFADICPFIIQHLCSACQVENEPDLVMSYIQFIAAHSQNDPVNIMVDFVMDMAQLIVERNTMFQHITPYLSATSSSTAISDSNQNNRRRQTLKCLFVMFNNYIIKLKEHQEPYEWVQYPDLLMVQFDDGAQLPIHLNIIHAFIILLTHSSNTIPESMPILDYWFPSGRGVPHAYLPNMSSEQVQFLPDWLKLKMIRSPVQRLVEAALYELTPDQIVLFVQNFGTPISSMSKLLALLDHAVIEQFEEVKIAILNKAYLAQLIKVQHLRGAKNGHVTIQALELHSHSQTVPDQPKLQVASIECVLLNNLKLKAHKINKMRTDVENIISEIMKNTTLNEFYKDKFRKLIRQMLHHCEPKLSCRKDCHLNLTKKILPYVILCADISKPALSFDNLSESKNICSLFRILLKHIETKHTWRNDFDGLSERISSLITYTVTLKTHNARLPLIFFKKLLILSKMNEGNYLKPGFNIIDIDQILYFVYHHNSSREVVYNMIKEKSTRILVENIIANLQIYVKQAEEYPSKKQCSQKGLLVDWIVEVDPELITKNKVLQLGLMFSESFKDFRCYLLSLLSHETNWDTLNETIDYLLYEFKPEYNESAILDFIEALMNNPRLWKGRDKTMSEKLKKDVLFILDEHKLEILTLYILKEAQSKYLLNPTKYKEVFQTRIELLIQISNKNNSFFLNCLEYVINHPSYPPVTHKFLEQMYMMHPKIKFMKRGLHKVYVAKLQNLNGFRCDKVTNYLITSLGNLFSRKDFETLSSDTELLMRKLAASHPSLFLRQLGVFCSQIQGKAHVNIFTLRDEHYIHRFTQILRTFEVLKPMIFSDEYTQCLQKGLECYLTFFKYHSREKETYQIVMKFVALLQAYIKENPSCAFLFIEKNTIVLQNLAANFKYLVPLQQLVQGLSLLKHKSRISSGLGGEDLKQEHCLDEAFDYKAMADSEAADIGIISNVQQGIGSKVATSIAFSEIQKQSMQVSTHIFHLFQIIKRSDVEEIILGPLQEIESVTSKRFYFINELFYRLLDLMFSTSAQVRSNAYILLIRHLKNQPGRRDIVRCALNAFVQCLCSDNSSVASTAVDNLVELVVLLQEHSIEILSIAFSLGIKSRASTSTQIKRAVQALMLQQGF